jgi:hypothetical protein
MQETPVTDTQAKELTAVLDGTAAYDDLKYKRLVEKNASALETMVRATTLRECDWGLEYHLGANAPVEYIRKAQVLGRLNVLYTYHLLVVGEKDHAVRRLTAGVRFSHDTANGGTLFAALIAKTLLVQHLRAIEYALRAAGLSAAQRTELQKALDRLGLEGLDWQLAMKRELDILNGLNAQAPAALAKITPSYLNTLNNAAELPALQRMIMSTAPSLSNVIPNPKRVLDEKQALTDMLRQTRLQLR